MTELVEEHARDRADVEVRFLQALRKSIPAVFDTKAQGPYEAREALLLDLIQP